MRRLAGLIAIGTRPPGPLRATWSVVEPLLMTGGMLWFGLALEPEDPFFLRDTFPWPLLVFLLIGLRYGFFSALLGLALYLMVLVLGWREGWLPYETLSYGHVVGLLVCTMVAGEFRDLWERRLNTLEAGEGFARLRLGEFTRSYHLLKVSNDQLEQQMAGSRISLREGVNRVTQLVKLEGGVPAITPALGRQFLSLVSSYAHAEEGAIFFKDAEGELHLLVHNGQAEHHSLEDPLLGACVEEGKIVTVAGENGVTEGASEWQAVIPVADSRGHLWGGLAVRQIPFWAFEDKTLRLLGVMAGHVADRLTDQTVIRANFSPALNALLANTQRCLQNARQYRVPSVLAVFSVAADDANLPLLDLIKLSLRGLDDVLEIRATEATVLAVLLPMTEESGYEGYLRRLEERVQERLGKSLASLPVHLQHHRLRSADAINPFFDQHLRPWLPDVDPDWHFA